MGKGYVYMATQNATTDAKTLILESGFISNSGWAWSAGDTLYVSAGTAGSIVNVAPAGSGSQVSQIGEALSATAIKFSPTALVIELA
jgi:hypothetical protein